MLRELTEDNLGQIVDAHHTVVVQYSAGWCGNCRIMKPKFKKMAQEMGEANFIVADAEKFPESRKMANVDNLPTFALFRDGKLSGQVQTNKLEVLKDFLHEITVD